MCKTICVPHRSFLARNPRTFIVSPIWQTDSVVATSPMPTHPISHSTCRRCPASICSDRCIKRNRIKAMPAGVCLKGSIKLMTPEIKTLLVCKCLDHCIHRRATTHIVAKSRTRSFFAHHGWRLSHCRFHQHGHMTQYGIIEFKGVFQFQQGFLVTF